jgi:hypothetical protein
MAAMIVVEEPSKAGGRQVSVMRRGREELSGYGVLGSVVVFLQGRG